MGLGFGADEHLVCLQPITQPSPAGEDLCLGYKYTFHFVGAPAYVTDDGYVAIVKGTRRYYPLSDDQLRSGQKDGLFPDPAPSYSLSPVTYVFGYSLWLGLAVAALLQWRSMARKRRGRAAAAAAATAPVAEGVRLDSEGDRYLDELFRTQLRTGETITHMAYGVDRDRRDGSLLVQGVPVGQLGTRGVLAALTGERLILIETPVGDFGPKTNRVVDAIDRARVRTVLRDDHTLIVGLDDGSARTLVIDPGYKHLSNQAAFLRDLPRLLGAPAAPGSVVAPVSS